MKIFVILKIGVPLDNVVAFGDGDNDIEFLRMAGRGIAMKNARDVAKSAANEVTLFSNDEDGVAMHLELMNLLNG